MKPDFALDLTHDGISLLYRGKGSWQRVGEVALDDPSMAEHLAELRAIAEGLVGGRVTSKLIIPDSQILYTTLEAPGPDDAAREVQIRAALEGMTPYPVSDLVFDWRADGDTARVAVLARETMDEAESFAVQFGFNPVSYVARPDTNAFSGEPFFGKTAHASAVLGSGERLVPDTSPVPRAPRQMALGDAADAPESPAPSAPSSASPDTLAPFPSVSEPDLPAPDAPVRAPDPAPDAARQATAQDGARPATRPGRSAPVFQAASGPVSDEPGTDTGKDTGSGTGPGTVSASDTDTVADTATNDGNAGTLASDGQDKTPEPAEKPARKPASERPKAPSARRDNAQPAPKLAPFPPTLDDDRPSPRTIRPIQRESAPAAPPAPSVAPPTASTPRRVDAQTRASVTDSPPEADTRATDAAAGKPSPTFASRRQPDPSGQDAPAVTAPATPGPGNTASPAPASTPASTPSSTRGSTANGRARNEAPKATPPLPVTGDDTAPAAPRATGELEKRRLAMARALGHANDTEPETKPRFSRLSGTAAGAAGAVGGLLGRARGGLSRNSESRAESRKARTEDVTAREALIPGSADDSTPEPSGQPLSAGATPFSTPSGSATEPAPSTPATDPAPRRGLLGRKAKPAPDPKRDARTQEAEAMTVFGARRDQSMGRRSSLSMGLVLTLILLLLFAGFAIWSSFFLSDEDTALFNPNPADPAITVPGDAPTTAPGTDDARPEDTAALTAEDDAQPDPIAEPSNVMSTEEATEAYASTGVWQRAPETPADPDTAPADDVYIASIDPAISPTDAIALPDADQTATAPPDTPAPPPPPGTTFELDENGLIIPTPDGAVSPTGAVVFSGPPPRVPAPRPEGLVPEAEVQEDAALAPGLSTDPVAPPRDRPDNLTELAERARLGGQSLAELSRTRPRARPDDLDVKVAVAAVDPVGAPGETTTADEAAPEAESTAQADPEATAPESFESASELAVAASLRPNDRPGNIEQLVARAQTRKTSPEVQGDGSTVVAASAATTRAVIPSSASVAQTATMKNALNLRNINLIGVYGSNASRRALVRLSSGRYVKVSVGDRLDGGKVIAISGTRLVYQKGSRQYALDVLPLG